MIEDKDKKPDAADADARARAQVDALLARPAALSVGAVTLEGGRRLEYEARAEFLPVLGQGLGDAQAGEPQAALFTVAYTQRGVAARERGVCFVFNGGPGSSSVWLHLGALGPRRVPVNDDGTMPPPPYAVVENPLTWLAHFDLVFIDPPHTGYSTSASEAARKKLLSVDGDVAALAELIRLWLVRQQRFASPVYLAGESYGTTRGAAIAEKLFDGGIALSGLVLVSCAMDLQSLVFGPRNDLPHALFLPGFALAAHYHGKLAGTPEAVRAAAEAFVQEHYLAALHAGARLDGRARQRVEKRLAELTGLPPALVAQKNLRITDQDMFLELLRPEGRVLGRLDARVSGPMAAHRTHEWEFDPGGEALNAPYTMAMMGYLAELGVQLDRRYEVLNMEVNKRWNWGRGPDEGGWRGMGYTSTSADLSRVLRRHPHLKVLAASGRYDLGTPYSASDWSLAQLDVPPEVLARVTHRYYDAGHMMYTRVADLRQLAADLAAWLA